MANGQRNCILWICCPPGSDESVKALAEEMAGELSLPCSGPLASAKGESYEDIARWVLENFDLAPKGSLQAFKDAIRDHAREGYVKVE